MATFRSSCHQITWRSAPLVEALDDIHEFGYRGVETFGTVIKDFAGREDEFKQMLSERELRLSALYGGGVMHDPATRRAAVEESLEIARFLQRMGSDQLVLGTGRRDPAGHPAEDYQRLAETLNEIARDARELGVVTGIHPHWNNIVQERDEITRIFDLVDTDVVKLAFDPAHVAKAGADPVEVAEAYKDILVYLHIKDYVPELDPERSGAPTAEDTPRQAFFGEMGTGNVDLPGLIDVLRGADYDGWVTVELDVSPTTPRESLVANTRYLTDVLGFDVSGESH